MKKFIKSSLAALILLIAVLVNGCDAFENFQFGLPVEFLIKSEGANNPSGSASYCLTENSTYLEYQDDINSITFAAAYLVTLNVLPATLTGDAFLRFYEGANQSGELLFEHIANNITPAEHDSTNAYKIELTSEQIANINASLASGNRCFYGEYSVQVASGGGTTNYILVRIDALFNVDAKLD